MKKFIVRTCCILVPFILALILFVSYGKMIYQNKEYPMWKSKNEYIKYDGSKKNIIIGDSRAVSGFTPKLLSNNFYNLAVGGGTPIEGFIFLEKLLKNDNKSIDTLIVSFGPMHLERSETFFERTLKFNILNYNQVKELFVLSRKMDEKFFSYSNNREYKSKLDYYKNYIRAILTYYNFPYYYRSNLRGFIEYPSRPFLSRKVYNEINHNLGYFNFGLDAKSSGLNREAGHKCFYPSKVIEYYLDKLIKLALDNNISIYFINTPMNETSYKNINPIYLEKYNEYMLKFKNKYPAIFWYDTIYCFSNKCFGDPSHMNPHGCQKFSLFVKKIILNKGENARTHNILYNQCGVK